MICVPHCIACPPDCTGLAGTPASTPASKPRNPAAHYTYIDLKCGHITTSRDHESHHGEPHPKGKPFWCDTCGHWVAKKPKPRYPDPTEPMY